MNHGERRFGEPIPKTPCEEYRAIIKRINTKGDKSVDAGKFMEVNVHVLRCNDCLKLYLNE